MNPDIKQRTGIVNTAIAVVWAAAALIGFCSLWRYANTVGEVGHAPYEWPSEFQRFKPIDGPTVLMFAHPRCPCTRASLDELERLLQRTGITGTVVFWNPETHDSEVSGWSDSDLIRLATKSGRMRTILDPGGRIARSFDVSTSGLTLIYDAGGALRFAGGITPSRGHVGRTSSTDYLESLLASEASLRADVELNNAQYRVTPVFGCPLWATGHGDTGT